MTSLRLSLDDTDFETLFEIARSQIPAVTPLWTDHNTHDPGIMLLELMAWAADQEIYALGHMRVDERFGYAALIGLRPSGPAPARGLVWPTTDPSSASSFNPGVYLHDGDAVAPERGDAPPFTLDHGLYLTPATLTGIQTISPAGGRVDWPLDGISQGAPLLPFGTSPRRGARLELALAGALLSAPPGPQQRPLLSLGFAAEQPDDADPPEVRQGRIRARLQADLAWPGDSIRLPIVHDRTSGFTGTGILLLDLTGVAPGPLVNGTVLRLTLRGPNLPVVPRLTAVALNVLPVRQERAARIGGSSTGLPDQEFSLDRDDPDPALSVDHTQVRFGKGVAPLAVTVNTTGTPSTWQLRDDLSTAGPDDEVFIFDPASGVVRFGNGLNGAIPPAGADLEVSCLLCQGKAGNLPAGLAWRAAGRAGFTNPEPIRGGVDLVDIAELRREARAHAQDDRPLVTNADLEAATEACTDLRVARAHVVPNFDPGRVGGQAGRSRTLVVVSSDPSRGETDGGPETAAWLRALRRRLTPRLPLGDRVRIIAPRYIPLRLHATLRAAANRDAAAIADKARRLLQARLAAVPLNPADPYWTLGRDVEPSDLKGWLRKLDGVVAVPEVRIGTTPNRLGDQAVKIPPHGLPQLTIEAGDITVVVATSGAQP